MSNRKKHFEDTLVAIGIGTLLTGATYGLYSYLKARQETPYYTNCPQKSPSPPKVKQKDVREDHRCSICLDAMTSHISTFDCQHSFHKKCIERWQAISKTCPICRMPFGEW